MRRWYKAAAVVAPVAVVAAVTMVGTAGAGPGDVIQNPGAVTLTVNGGGFINLSGKSIPLPGTSTPPQCSDGVNNDTAVDANATPPNEQDLNIDFDGGASHGVSPATAVDAQCVAGGGFTAAQDDSEAKAGNQPRQYIRMNATVDKDGNVSVPQAGITFPPFYVFSKQANVIDITPTATGPATGTLNPATGKANLHVDWQLRVQQAFWKIDCIAPISMDLSSDPTDPANSGALSVTPVPYNKNTGDVTVTGNTFAAGGFTPTGLVSKTTGVATAGSTTFTDPSGSFTAADVGKGIRIAGAGTGGAEFATAITAVTNATTITLTAAPVLSVNPASYNYSTAAPGLCTTVGSGFGLPSVSGANSAQLSVSSNVAFTPGAPVAVTDIGTTPYETPLVVAAAGVMTNDSGDGISVTANTNGTHGTASVSANGAYTYTPNAGYSGPDSFTYTITDSLGRTAEGTVNITVSPPTSVPGIQGTVTAQVGGAPLQGIVVTLMDGNPGWHIINTAITDVNGKYSFTGLANGTYSVRFFDASANYGRTWYDSKQTYKSANVLTITSPSDALVANQALPPRPTGYLTGRAQLGTGAGIAGVDVYVYTENSGFYAYAQTGANGYYYIGGVPPGKYWVWFQDPQHRYLSQWYNFKLLFFNANLVTVGTDQTWANALLG